MELHMTKLTEDELPASLESELVAAVQAVPQALSLNERLREIANYAIKRLEVEHNQLVSDKGAEVRKQETDLSANLSLLDHKAAQLAAAKDELLAQMERYRARVDLTIAESAERKRLLCAAQRATLSALHTTER
jgi:hypothetical protein